MIYFELSKEIDEMAAKDQLARAKYFNGEGEPDLELDKKNTTRLKEIVEEIGWPGISKVGPTSSNNAWLLAQHSDHDIAFQIECLTLMKAEQKNEVAQKNIAFLEDRILVNKGLPQIYGTQFKKDSFGKWLPKPIENRNDLNVRRLGMGLESFEEYETKINSM